MIEVSRETMMDDVFLWIEIKKELENKYFSQWPDYVRRIEYHYPTMSANHRGVHAELTVLNGVVTLKFSLPMLLHIFSGTVRQEVEKAMDEFVSRL